MPPPSGSPSISMVRRPLLAAVTASAQASVDAPAPPRPPITPTVSAGLPTPSAALAIRSTSQLSASGSRSTYSAPISTPCRQTSGVVLVAPHEHHALSARGSTASRSRVVAHQNHRSALPAASAVPAASGEPPAPLRRPRTAAADRRAVPHPRSRSAVRRSALRRPADDPVRWIRPRSPPLLPAPSPRFRGDLGAFRDRRYPEPADFAGGITVQRFGKSCGSCSKTVDNSSQL